MQRSLVYQTPFEARREQCILWRADPLAGHSRQLALTRAEYEELLRAYCKAFDFPQLMPAIQEELFQLTAGHVGLITLVLDRAAMELRTYGVKVDPAVRRLLKAPDIMFTGSHHIRSFMRKDAFQYWSQKGWFFELFSQLNSTGPEGLDLDGPLYAQAKALQHAGYLHMAGDRASFITPLHQIYYQNQLYRSQLKYPRFQESFETFLEAIIMRIRPEVLRTTLSKCQDPSNQGRIEDIYERQFQMEFYDAAYSCLPANAFIYPDVSKKVNIDGYLDFYITLDKMNSKAWAVELLCQGDEADEHAQRFLASAPGAPRNKYEGLNVVGYMLIDFRSAGRMKPRKLRDSFRVAVYGTDYNSITIYAKDQEPRLLIPNPVPRS